MGEGCQAAGGPCIVTQERIHAVKPQAEPALGGSGCGAPGPKLEAGFRPLHPRQAESRTSPDVKRRSRLPWPWGRGHKSTFLRAGSLTCEMRGQTETSRAFLALQVVSWWLNLRDTFPEGKGLRWDWVLLCPPLAIRTNPREGGLRLRALSLTKPLLTPRNGPSLTCLAC